VTRGAVRVGKAVREGGLGEVGGLGYMVGYRLAAENLGFGLSVVADSVNPWPLTRAAWRQAAEGHPYLEVEVVCSDAAEHRRPGAPVAAKSFSPTSIQSTGANANAASTLSITITNPNPALTMTGVSFTDTYPVNLLNASVPNPALSCTIGSSAIA